MSVCGSRGVGVAAGRGDETKRRRLQEFPSSRGGRSRAAGTARGGEPGNIARTVYWLSVVTPTGKDVFDVKKKRDIGGSERRHA